MKQPLIPLLFVAALLLAGCSSNSGDYTSDNQDSGGQMVDGAKNVDSGNSAELETEVETMDSELSEFESSMGEYNSEEEFLEVNEGTFQ